MISLGDWGIWKTNLTFWKKTPLVLSSQILSVSIPFPWLCKNQLSFLQKVKLIIHFKEISIWVWGVGEDFGSTVRELENSVLMNTILSVYAWQSHFFTVAFSHIFTASFFLFFSLLVFLIQQSIHISQMINGQCNFVTAVSHGRISIWCGCEMKYDPYLCLLLHCKIIFPPLFFFSLCVVSKNSAYKNEQKFSKVI